VGVGARGAEPARSGRRGLPDRQTRPVGANDSRGGGNTVGGMAFTQGPGGVHVYSSTCTWAGSTALGYERYGRQHRIESPPATTALELSNDPSLGGDAGLLDPEQLVLAAAASCQLLSFLAVAARARVDVIGYRDDAEARMSTDRPHRIATITLRPAIRATGTTGKRILHLVEVAHRECYVANSLSTPVDVVATVQIE
jgi:organic hydroperoxide reductase OsmC/OhrA